MSHSGSAQDAASETLQFKENVRVIRYKGFVLFERMTFDIWAETKAAKELLEANGITGIAFPPGVFVGNVTESSLADLKAYIDVLHADDD